MFWGSTLLSCGGSLILCEEIRSHHIEAIHRGTELGLGLYPKRRMAFPQRSSVLNGLEFLPITGLNAPIYLGIGDFYRPSH